MASPVGMSTELGPQDTSRRSQPNRGGKHKLTALLLMVNPRSKFPVPSIYTGNSKCCLQSNPIFHFQGKRQPGIFTCRLREATRASQSLRLQEKWYLISQKLFSTLTILSSKLFQRFKPTKGTECVKTCDYFFYQLRASTTNSSKKVLQQNITKFQLSPPPKISVLPCIAFPKASGRGISILRQRRRKTWEFEVYAGSDTFI